MNNKWKGINVRYVIFRFGYMWYVLHDVYMEMVIHIVDNSLIWLPQRHWINTFLFFLCSMDFFQAVWHILQIKSWLNFCHLVKTAGAQLSSSITSYHEIGTELYKIIFQALWKFRSNKGDTQMTKLYPTYVDFPPMKKVSKK